MTKLTIALFQETKPAHYAGADCSIILKYKSNFAKWEIDGIENMIITILENNDYSEIESSPGLIR